MVYELLLSMQDRSDDVYTGAVCLVQNIHAGVDAELFPMLCIPFFLCVAKSRDFLPSLFGEMCSEPLHIGRFSGPRRCNFILNVG